MVLTTHVQTEMSLKRANYTHLHERKVDNTFFASLQTVDNRTRSRNTHS